MTELDRYNLCNCSEAQETHEHCADCDCILTSYESENLCRWCEERKERDND